VRQSGAEPVASFLTAAGFVTALAWALIHLLPPLNGDAAAILYFADRMVAGDRLYVDLIDVNPPLIFWLNVLPAWVARQFDANPATTFVWMVLALHALSFGLCRRSLREIRELQTPFARTLVPLVVAFALLILPGETFGQRGHLMVVLVLPYLALSVRRLQGDAPPVRSALIAGLMGALGFLIKPYFLVIPLAIELALVGRQGWRTAVARPEPFMLAIGGTLYTALALVYCPAYFVHVLPLVEKYYLTPSLRFAVDRVFGVEGRWIGLLAMLPIAGLALVSRRPALLIATLFTLSAALVAAIQGKGWPYHLLPFWQGVVVSGAIVAAAVTERLRERASAGLWRAGAVGLFASLVGVAALDHTPFDDQLRYPQSLAGRLQGFVARYATGRPVLWLTDAVYPHYPVVLYDRAAPAMGFMELWLIDSFYRGQQPPSGRPIMRLPTQMSPDERAVFEQVGTALERTRPSLVLVASAATELGVPAGAFDYLAYFLEHPSFAREWKHYHQVAVIDGTRVFRRTDVAPQ
jgi:hypothetical protein